MCGICGSLSLTSDPVDTAGVRAMLEQMEHRGPDGSGLFERPGIVAGARRLAVIDIEHGDQPMTNEDGDVHVVFNGEIYNHGELRDELTAAGHRFRTRSDTEVLVHLWEERGTAMVDRLNGMFAFCVHDTRTGETFLARDRLGIKPLFYSSRGDRLDFASEVATLLRHPDVPGDVDMDVLVELFCLQYAAGERSIYRGIRKLLPGCALHVRSRTVRMVRYYELPREQPDTGSDIETAAEELLELFESAVRYRLISDVPLGAFLSGGLDSSAVVEQASRLLDRPVQTFSVGFDDDAAFDEREYARIASRALGTDHHELVVSADDVADRLPGLIEHLAEPVLDPAMLPTLMLSEFSRREVTVALTGEGADELFGGYRRYLFQERFGWLSRLPGVGRVGQGALFGVLPRRARQALQAIAEEDPARNHLEWSSTVGRADAARLFDPQVYAGFVARVRDGIAPYFSGDRIRVEDQLRADQQEWLPHNLLAKVDRATMANSLEARVPFLDHRLVEWAAGLPADHKIHAGESKLVLRRAFADRLPRAILDRPKRGFDLPLAAWIRGPLRPLVDDLLTPAQLARWEGLNATTVRAMLDQHLADREDYGLPLFNALSIMIFLEGCHA